ncbi:MAG: universal stress protein [Syntrophobacteraceae bacterium]
MAYTSIVCGVTGSQHAQEAALRAAMLAKEDNARLTYVYAVDTTFLRSGVAMQCDTCEVAKSLEHLGNHILAMAEALAQLQGVTPKKVVRKGKVLEVLKSIVVEEQADLLVLGHEKRTFFEKAMFQGDVEDHIDELKRQTGVEVNVVR